MRSSLAVLLLACAPALAEPADVVEYGVKGTREAGGFAGFMIAPEFHSVTVAPSFGWFIADHVQVSTILGLTNIKAGESNTTIVTTTLEPSYHHKLDTKTYAFVGAGFGYSYVHQMGSGLAFTIRVGTHFLIGRTGVFTPSVTYDLRSNEVDRMAGLAEIATTSAVRVNLGYTTIW